jgi:hypothetical protein
MVPVIADRTGIGNKAKWVDTRRIWKNPAFHVQIRQERTRCWSQALEKQNFQYFAATKN